MTSKATELRTVALDIYHVNCSRFLVTGKAHFCKEGACYGCRMISRSKTVRLLQQGVTGAAVVTVDFEGARFETRSNTRRYCRGHSWLFYFTSFI